MNSRTAAAVLALTLCLIWISSRTHALPAFARKHDISCTACHDPFPSLNQYGEEFAANAFKPRDKTLSTRYFRDVGDGELSLLESLPLAARADLTFEVRTDDKKGDGFSDFKAPFDLKLLSGGRLADDIGYYFLFSVSEFGEVVGIQDAYLHFNDLFGTRLDILVGQFQVSDPLFKRNLRLTFQDYLLYEARPGLSQTDLSYDRGVMLSYGFNFGLDISGIIVNGNGKGGGDLAGDFDLDRYKNYMLRLSQGIGPVRFGVVGYWGKEESTQGIDSSGTVVDLSRRRANEILVWGADITLSLRKAEINAQYLQRRDINPYFGSQNEPFALVTHGYLVEAIANIWGDPAKLFLVAVFNLVDSNSTDGEGNPIREEAYTANLTYMLRSNIKLLAEYTFARFRLGGEVKEHRATLGVVGAF